MDISLDLADLDPSLLREINRQAAAELLQACHRAVPAIRKRVQEAVDTAIRSVPEWDSLIGGRLREELGVAQAEPVLDRVLLVIKENILVQVENNDGDSLGAISVRILQSDFQDVLSVPGTSYVSYSAPHYRGGSVAKPSVETPIEWLRMLLFSGTDIVFPAAEINLDAVFRPASRTGRAIMIRPTSRQPRGWGMPPEFSGTAEDNFLTRAVSLIADDVANIIFEEVVNNL